MKITHLFFGFRMGGAESMVIDLANRQAASGHKVSLVILNDETDPALVARLDKRISVRQMRRSPGSRNPWPLLKLNSYIFFHRPHILHFHNINLPGAVIASLRRKAVMTLHTTSLPIEQARGAKLVAISKQVAREVTLNYPSIPVTTIYNAIDFDAVKRRSPRSPGAMVKLIQLGRVFSEIKGQDLVIEALAILKARGIENISIDFIGPGPEIESLTALADRLGVADRVKFHGVLSRAETYKRLADYDLLVHPSRIEGFGLAIIEGMAAGLPVITTDRGAPAEIAEHGRLARLFRYGDSESLADAIAAEISDYSAALERADKAFTETHRLYALSSMVDAYHRLYSSL